MGLVEVEVVLFLVLVFQEFVDRFKKQWEARKKQQQSLDGRVTSIEQKLDKLMNHLGVK